MLRKKLADKSKDTSIYILCILVLNGVNVCKIRKFKEYLDE